MKNEKLQKMPETFPIGRSSSERAFSDFFSKSNRSSESNITPYGHELDIMRTHYKPSHKFMVFVSKTCSETEPSMDFGHFMMGMAFLHHAARVEAQTKRAVLPQISEDQMIKYIVNQGLFEFDVDSNVGTKVNYEPLRERFQKEETSMNNALMRLRLMRRFPEFLAGASVMRDFLKVAPTIETTNNPK